MPIRSRNVKLADLLPTRFAASTYPIRRVVATTTAALAAGTYTNLPDQPTFTITATGALGAQDGVTLAVNDRLLVKDQVSGIQNGIYYVEVLGATGISAVLRRVLDFNKGDSADGAFIYVDQGTLNIDTTWVESGSSTPKTIGTSNIAFMQSSAAGMSYATTAQIADVGVTEAAGTSATVARGDHVHDLTFTTWNAIAAEAGATAFAIPAGAIAATKLEGGTNTLGLDASDVRQVTAAGTVGAIPVTYMFDIGDVAGADYDKVLAVGESIIVTDVVVTKVLGAGGAGCAVTVKNAANLITDVIDCNDADGVISRPLTISVMNASIAGGGTLRVTHVRGAANGAVRVIVSALRHA